MGKSTSSSCFVSLKKFVFDEKKDHCFFFLFFDFSYYHKVVIIHASIQSGNKLKVIQRAGRRVCLNAAVNKVCITVHRSMDFCYGD